MLTLQTTVLWTPYCRKGSFTASGCHIGTILLSYGRNTHLSLADKSHVFSVQSRHVYTTTMIKLRTTKYTLCLPSNVLSNKSMVISTQFSVEIIYIIFTITCRVSSTFRATHRLLQMFFIMISVNCRNCLCFSVRWRYSLLIDNRFFVYKQFSSQIAERRQFHLLQRSKPGYEKEVLSELDSVLLKRKMSNEITE